MLVSASTSMSLFKRTDYQATLYH